MHVSLSYLILLLTVVSILDDIDVNRSTYAIYYIVCRPSYLGSWSLEYCLSIAWIRLHNSTHTQLTKWYYFYHNIRNSSIDYICIKIKGNDFTINRQKASNWLILSHYDWFKLQRNCSNYDGIWTITT